MVAASGQRAVAKALIVGGGPAGDAVAAGLRDAGFDGEVVLVGAEPEPPYERPHLSKGYLLGTVPDQRLGLRPAEQYRELGIEVRQGERVIDLGVERRTAVLESGRAISWDVLCIATGSSARSLRLTRRHSTRRAIWISRSGRSSTPEEAGFRAIRIGR